MHTIFPAYNHTEGDTLFIIGNGFDLAHSMRTKYADFRDWLKSQGEHILVEDIEYYFNIDPETWSDFEHALGDYDLQTLYKNITGSRKMREPVIVCILDVVNLAYYINLQFSIEVPASH